MHLPRPLPPKIPLSPNPSESKQMMMNKCIWRVVMIHTEQLHVDDASVGWCGGTFRSQNKNSPNIINDGFISHGRPRHRRQEPLVTNGKGTTAALPLLLPWCVTVIGPRVCPGIYWTTATTYLFAHADHLNTPKHGLLGLRKKKFFKIQKITQKL